MVPRDAIRVDVLPHTDSGKVRKMSVVQVIAA